MRIKGFQKTSMIDYPGKICSTIFLARCNFKCGYCYNPELVLDKGLLEIKEGEVLKKLKERSKFIDAVTITGGEPTLHKGLPGFIEKIKKLKLLVKLDTNGANPVMLKQLIDKGIIDFIAMDVKNVFEKYERTVNVKIDPKKIEKSIRLIKNSGLDHEFRITVLPRLHKKQDMIKIAKEYLVGAKKYVLQQFFSAEKMLDESFIKEKPFGEAELEEIKKECNKYVKTEIRNL